MCGRVGGLKQLYFLGLYVSRKKNQFNLIENAMTVSIMLHQAYFFLDLFTLLGLDLQWA